MSSDPSFLSIVPILITLALSLWTRNVVIGLFVGVLSGVLFLNGINLLDGTQVLIRDYLVVQLTSSYNAAVLVLLVFIGGFVHLMETSGGGPAFASKVVKYVDSKRKAQIFTWMGGIFIFYSDIGTPLIIGPIFRPLFDKMKISREKLAFIIDSTASPVAIMIPFIGWGVYTMSLIDKELPGTGVTETSFSLFVSAIPFQFYAILAVLIVPWITISLLDFGPMAKAEKDSLIAKPDLNMSVRQPDESTIPFSHERASASFVFVPLFVMAFTLLAALVPQGFPYKPMTSSMFLSALATAYFFAAISLMILVTIKGVRRPLESVSLYLKGMNGMMQIAITLILAWTLSVIGKDMGAPLYISNIVEAGVPPWILPACVFLLGGIISFATGSSWGTFAILFPLVIPAAIAIDAPLVVVIASVLSGGLFGDHCSPISETTILSSTGAGCEQFEHFRTQLPYALFNGGVALLTYLVAGFYPTPLLVLFAIILQILGMFVVFKFYRT